MQIHEVVEQLEQKHELDPRHGVRLRTERVIVPSTTHVIAFDGETYEAENGTFDVPAEVAEFYLGRPGWFSGPNPFAEKVPAKRAKTAV